jgi:L,D-transpeptidase ErfK/SrfK
MKFHIRTSLWFFGCLAVCVALRANAAAYPVPENGDTIVGQLRYVHAHKSDTLVDIARRFDVGFNEITSVNPGIDPWLPPQNALVVIPSRFVLPEKPWRGIIVNLAEMRLFYFPEQQQPGAQRVVYTFPLGIGRRSWPTPEGSYRVVEKIKDPVWTVPASVLHEAKVEGVKMPTLVPPGDDNPLGKYALLLDEKGYLIHGTNKPFGIGRRVSHGCVRLYPKDIAKLFQHVPRGTPVRIEKSPVKFGKYRGVLYVESNNSDARRVRNRLSTDNINQIVAMTDAPLSSREWSRVSHSLAQSLSIPIPVTGIPLVADKSEPMYLQVNSGIKPVVTKQLKGIFGAGIRLTTVGPCGKVRKCSRLGPLDSKAMGVAVAELLRDGYSLRSHLVRAANRTDHAAKVFRQ